MLKPLRNKNTHHRATPIKASVVSTNDKSFVGGESEREGAAGKDEKKLN